LRTREGASPLTPPGSFPNFCQYIERRNAMKNATGMDSGKSTGCVLGVPGVPGLGSNEVCEDGTTVGFGLGVDRGFELAAGPSPETCPGACQKRAVAIKPMRMRFWNDFKLNLGVSLRLERNPWNGVFTLYVTAGPQSSWLVLISSPIWRGTGSMGCTPHITRTPFPQS
jgi:hypothetical protein